MEDNKLYVNEKNQIGTLDRIIDISNLSVIETHGKKIVHNNNLLFLNKNIDHSINNNRLIIELNLGDSRCVDKDTMEYEFLVKIELDNSILFINKFRNNIEVVVG